MAAVRPVGHLRPVYEPPGEESSTSGGRGHSESLYFSFVAVLVQLLLGV